MGVIRENFEKVLPIVPRKEPITDQLFYAENCFQPIYMNEVSTGSHNYDAEYIFHQSWQKIITKSRIIVAMPRTRIKGVRTVTSPVMKDVSQLSLAPKP